MRFSSKIELLVSVTNRKVMLMPKYSIAVDIGASSGRLILGYLEDRRLKLDEIHRFENKIVRKVDSFCWEADKLFQEVKNGLKKCKELGIKPDSIGIDTWDDEEVFELFSKERLYLETGIQFQKFNTIYQLYSIKKNHPESLEKAKSFLMIPD